LCDADGKFGYMFQDNAAAMTIKVIELFGEVGGDFLRVWVLGVIRSTLYIAVEKWREFAAGPLAHHGPKLCLHGFVLV